VFPRAFSVRPGSNGYLMQVLPWQTSPQYRTGIVISENQFVCSVSDN